MEEHTYQAHEVLTTSVNARFEPEDVWEGAKLVTSHEEFSDMIRASG